MGVAGARAEASGQANTRSLNAVKSITPLCSIRHLTLRLPCKRSFHDVLDLLYVPKGP
jgi:hypothetical protein